MTKGSVSQLQQVTTIDPVFFYMSLQKCKLKILIYLPTAVLNVIRVFHRDSPVCFLLKGVILLQPWLNILLYILVPEKKQHNSCKPNFNTNLFLTSYIFLLTWYKLTKSREVWTILFGWISNKLSVFI